MSYLTLHDLDVANKTVIVRADLNVPAQKGKVTDTTRIDRLKPTIDYLVKHKAKILLLSHFGRPEGEQNPAMSLAFLLSVLQECWGCKVRFSPDCIGEPAQQLAHSLKSGEIGLLENVRFHKGEKANDPDFAKALASLGDIYVNDAFSAAHRAHASTEGIAAYLPSAAGMLMKEELNALNAALESPKKPVVAIAGGSKISTKISVLTNLIKKTDYLVLGGGMANTFLNAQGHNVGSSLCEKNMATEALQIMNMAQEQNCRIILPTDFVAVEEIGPDAPYQIVPATLVPDNARAIDIGPDSICAITKVIEDCKTVLWNGPLGIFEIKPFDAGTNALAKAVAEQTQAGTLISIAGGGDTVAALENSGYTKDFTYVSSAGGAFLEWLEGKPLPGVAALLKDKKAA